MALFSNFYAVKVQRLEKIVAQKKAAKVPKKPSYGYLWKVTQNPRFLEKCKRGNKEKFKEMGQN